MKKAASIILALISVFVINITVYAAGDFENDISDRLFSSFDSDIADRLEDFGISGLDSESIYNISFESVISYYKSNFTDLLTGSLKMFARLLTFIMLTAFAAMIIDSEKYKKMISLISVLVVTVLVVENVNLCLSSAMSLLKLNGTFMSSFVPVYALVIAVGGNPASALTYNSLVFSFAQAVSSAINYGFIDLLGCFFCLSIAFSVSDSVNFSRLISATNRIATFFLGLSASVFASLLTVKSIFSYSADSVASKGIRFAIGSLIPVIGSSISEAYSAVLGSINIIKGSVAIVGIIVILIINLPVIIEIMLFYFSLSSLGFICEMVDLPTLSNAFKGFSCGIKITGILVIFEMFILIISTGIMMSLRGG